MEEYISRETIRRTVLNYNPENPKKATCWAMMITDLLRDIDNLPAADVQSVNQWISVEDKLPIEQGPVLCYARSTTGEGNYRILGTLRNGEFWFLQVDGTQLSFPCLHLKVTHWMPLPEPPKDGDSE